MQDTTQPAPLVRLERTGGAVAVLTLDRAASRNALSIGMIEAIEAALEEIKADKAIRAVVLTGAGPAFCAGHDLKEMTAHRADADGGRAFFKLTMLTCARMMKAIVHLPKPVIAAVNGIASAAGCQLVATCDLAVAGDTAKFCTPGVSIGLFCSTPMVALSRNVPRKRAIEMLLGGDMIDAMRAADWGLVNTVVPADRVLAEAIAMAEGIAARSAVTVAIGKASFYRQLEMGLAEAYDYAGEVMVENMLARDAGEGICAFIEKRKPEWTHE